MPTPPCRHELSNPAFLSTPANETLSPNRVAVGNPLRHHPVVLAAGASLRAFLARSPAITLPRAAAALAPDHSRRRRRHLALALNPNLLDTARLDSRSHSL